MTSGIGTLYEISHIGDADGAVSGVPTAVRGRTAMAQMRTALHAALAGWAYLHHRDTEGVKNEISHA